MGSFLCTRNATQWRATLDGLRNNPSLDKRIMTVLRISFEGLEPREREIFLHIACFFKGEKADYVRGILDACGLHPDIGIPLIAEKSLITIRNNEIHMHGMLQELGRQIVQGQHPNEPEFWSRLWLYRDFHRVMMTEMKAPIEVKAIVLDQKEDGSEFNKLRAEDLSKLGHLKLLILCHKNFSGEPIFLSNSLCYLSWNGFPFDSLPSNIQLHDLVELNMPDSNIKQLWEGIQRLPCLKRMDLSNSKNLRTTPSFEGIQNLERIDFTGCINLLQVHPSVGLLTELVFLSLQNCTNLTCLDFGSVSRVWSLRVLRLSGCIGLRNTPDFTVAANLEYLDMERCINLSKIDKSIGTLTKLRFLSLRHCTKLFPISNIFDNMTSLTTLDLCECWNFTTLPLPTTVNSPSPLESLIFLDLSFCNISVLPDSIGKLKSLERLNLQGNHFTTLPSTFKRLANLAYLNLSHCHRLKRLPKLPTKSGQSDSVGRYFKTTSGSRDHRSGLYIYDCPKLTKRLFSCEDPGVPFKWLKRLFKEPRHFRCGFDIVLPLHRKHIDLHGNPLIPQWFDYKFEKGSIITIKNSNMHVDWVGFAFCVAFQIDNRPAVSGSPYRFHSSPLPYPFCLSFESEHTEECFDMPLSLERNKVAGSNYIWVIYISREHCHFVKTGAQITFKAGEDGHGLIMKKWGFRVLTKKGLKRTSETQLPMPFIENVGQRSRRVEPKIKLPYNWSVSDEDEVENEEAKGKEINLFNLGLLTGRLH
ncbi:putative winged helix-turn-helix DNA-binding domain, leucine-rich repeat domain, L [Medicago truncatula]|uniref:Putative winged helix-turn-helix DNA-binding domain, leucine-rich repeat domain, L n=1 Tax=Medicago truncatula TaxID=3880 RepID=A0A396HJ28_MEDTR|nr:putative winged helix-turn-helix DNA-binding domain, leucine-rich repeat domain, L [Medicago truncatula]